MKKQLRLLLAATILAGSLSSSGCASYVGLASHTLAAGPDVSTDVVWVVRNQGSPQQDIIRCTQSNGAPVCQQASMP